jgi:small-conductance mechanosensitive channel
MHDAVKELTHQIALFLPRVGVSLLVLFAFWLASVILQKVIQRVGKRSQVGQDMLNLLERTAKVGLLLFGTVTALGTVGVNVAALVAGLGLMGFALGFALRDVLSNLLAGVLILLYRPFQRHDRIAVAGFEGAVVEIGLRYTTLRADDKYVLIPNATLFTNPISIMDPKQ